MNFRRLERQAWKPYPDVETAVNEVWLIRLPGDARDII
jgi:hypothetical protein